MKNTTTEELMRFLDAAPVSWLACRRLCERLEEAGFTALDERDAWRLNQGDRRYVVKNGSAVTAFVVGAGGDPGRSGYNIVAAHSDSPGFRIKPRAAMTGEGGVTRLNTEVYGGPILYTWFDRPLSVAGRVILRTADPLRPEARTVDLKRPLLTIPHLAIHYNRSVNEGNPLSKQRDMLPVIGTVNDKLEAEGLVTRLVANALDVDPKDILDFDLGLYDTTPACLLGLNNEYITSGRLDDLMMAHLAVEALIDTADKMTDSTRVVAIFDNEETGSGTKQGAASPWLMNILSRINRALGDSEECHMRRVAASFMVSADNAHALHPNYVDKQDPTNHPLINGGPVVKINANCKYMTDGESAAVFDEVCRLANVPVQRFVNHSDVAGGSTLGNILTSQIDLRGVDMGAAMWAMHSCRETAGVHDADYCRRAFATFFSL